MNNDILVKLLNKQKVEEISKLPVKELLLLQKQTNLTLADAKHYKAILDNALELKFFSKAKSSLLSDGRDTGTAHFIEDNHQITVDLPKRVNAFTGNCYRYLGSFRISIRDFSIFQHFV